MPQVKGQQDKRRAEFWLDQHKREYWVNVEMDTGDDCSPPSPNGWTAPAAPSWAKGLLVPPLDDRDICKRIPMRQRGRMGYQIFIDYAAWLQKWDAANEARQQKLHDFAKGMSGGINLMEAVNNPPPVLLAEVGPPPSPPRAMIEAAAAGNAWALGLSTAVPAKAQALLDQLRPQLAASRTGLSGIDPFAEDGAGSASLEMEDEVPEFVRAAAQTRFDDAFADDVLAATVSEAASVQPKRRGAR